MEYDAKLRVDGPKEVQAMTSDATAGGNAARNVHGNLIQAGTVNGDIVMSGHPGFDPCAVWSVWQQGLNHPMYLWNPKITIINESGFLITNVVISRLVDSKEFLDGEKDFRSALAVKGQLDYIERLLPGNRWGASAFTKYVDSSIDPAQISTSNYTYQPNDKSYYPWDYADWLPEFWYTVGGRHWKGTGRSSKLVATNEGWNSVALHAKKARKDTK